MTVNDREPQYVVRQSGISGRPAISGKRGRESKLPLVWSAGAAAANGTTRTGGGPADRPRQRNPEARGPHRDRQPDLGAPVRARRAHSQLAGRFRRWWQVVNSNHRRRSRRFCRPLATSGHLKRHQPGNSPSWGSPLPPEGATGSQEREQRRSTHSPAARRSCVRPGAGGAGTVRRVCGRRRGR